MYIYMYIHIHMHIYIYIYRNTFIHVYVFTCLFILIYLIHTQEYTHTIQVYPFTRSIKSSDRCTKEMRHKPDIPSNAIEATRWKNDTVDQNSEAKYFVGQILCLEIKNTKLRERAKKRLEI